MDHTVIRAWLSGYAEARGWRVGDAGQGWMDLEIDVDPEAEIVYYVQVRPSEAGDRLRLRAPMSAGYVDEADLPHDFASRLLLRNAEIDAGFWCLTDVDGNQTFACVVETLPESLEDEGFAEIMDELVGECLAGENLLAQWAGTLRAED